MSLDRTFTGIRRSTRFNMGVPPARYGFVAESRREIQGEENQGNEVSIKEINRSDVGSERNVETTDIVRDKLTTGNGENKRSTSREKKSNKSSERMRMLKNKEREIKLQMLQLQLEAVQEEKSVMTSTMGSEILSEVDISEEEKQKHTQHWVDQNFLITLMSYMDKYGPTIRVHDGPLSVSVISEEEKFMEFYLSSPKLIDKADQYTYLHNWLGNGLLTSAGAKWKKRRRMLNPAFHISIVESFVEIFDTVGDIFMNKLEREVGQASFDINPYVTFYTLDVICEAAMGITLNAQDNRESEYVRSVKTMCEIIIGRMFSPFDARLYPFTWNYFKEKKAVKVLHALTDAVIDEKIANKSSNKIHFNSENKIDKKSDDVGMKHRLAFLDLLLETTVDGQSLSRVEIREEVDTLMFAGHDTTASAITFAIYCLANNPEVQRKALEEQRSIFADLSKAKSTVADLHEMKYMELIIKETLRLYPSVPFIGRKAPEDFEFEGVIYPKNVNIMFFPFTSHRNPKYFPEPLKFIPERFENFDGINPHPYAYVPFSAGPRNCIGQKFAMLEMKSTLSKILRHFELLPSTPAHQLRLAAEAILVSKNGVRISIRKRTDQS